ncbi:CYTH domain-containing protein [candidate division KSB1 bacterium]|nr:CYTH domain-containing protein [bacterium]NUM66597.1 CYTH domain-containing protein [candidate division KSB1 bacterium]
MAKEVERKFLVKGLEWKRLAEGVAYRQGYLSTVKERTVRVRTVGDKGYLTIKGLTVGVTRSEFEYEIPVADANALLDDLCERPLIEKNRYKVAHAGLTWEIDEFFGENNGLVVAEVELQDAQQKIELPAWIGEEVSGDPRYFNANLIKHPYTKWQP